MTTPRALPGRAAREARLELGEPRLIVRDRAYMWCGTHSFFGLWLPCLCGRLSVVPSM